jgi:uncharacterized UBP type Zn finger protein
MDAREASSQIPQEATQQQQQQAQQQPTQQQAPQQAAQQQSITRITSPIPGLRGIRNLGNTCYVSSALQVLTHLTPFRQVMQPIIEAGPINVGELPLAQQPRATVINALSNVMREIWSGSSAEAINIQPLLTALDIVRGVTGDAHEVLLQIMDNVEGIDNIVEFQTGGRRHCAGCTRVVDTSGQGHRIMPLVLTPSTTRITLREAMEIMFLPEELHGYRCEDCNQSTLPVQVYDRRFVQNPRDVLIFSVQRVNPLTGGRINTVVDFPIEMDLSSMPGGGNGRYRLVGIVNHDGSHYTCEVTIDGNWYMIDDSIVFSSGNQPIQTQSARVTQLLYERIDSTSR